MSVIRAIGTLLDSIETSGMMSKNGQEQEFKIKYYGGEAIYMAETTRMAIEKFELDHPGANWYSAGPTKFEPTPMNMDEIDQPTPF